MRRLLPIIAIVLLTAGCAPFLPAIVELWEHNDSATLTYVVNDPDYDSDGVLFTAGDAPARGVAITIDGVDLTLVEFPVDAECRVKVTVIECLLGTVDNTAFVGVIGGDVLATASWRRTGNTVYRVLARLPAP